MSDNNPEAGVDWEKTSDVRKKGPWFKVLRDGEGNPKTPNNDGTDAMEQVRPSSHDND